MGNSNTRIVSIEGNIGSGKSTLLAHLKDHFADNDNIIFLGEPVSEWDTIKDAEGNTMLKKFYADQEKYSFPFQMMAYISRLALLKNAMKENEGAVIITERSLYTDKYVFAKMLYDMKKIEDVNYQIYSKWFDTFAQECELSQIIYVKAGPTTCYERIKKRSRNGEDRISLEYLTQCNEYHEQMIHQFQIKEELQTLVLDGNVDINENTFQLRDWLKEIKMFIDM